MIDHPWGPFNTELKLFPKVPVHIDKESLNAMLFDVARHGVDDVILRSETKIFAKFEKHYYPLTVRPLREEEVKRILTIMTAVDSSFIKVLSGSPMDNMAYVSAKREGGLVKHIRWRINATACLGFGGAADTVDITMRKIPSHPIALETIGLPHSLCEPDGGLFPSTGLVLISGETGSGKTNTLASIIAKIGEQIPSVRILSYEQPIEFDFRSFANMNASISQTSIGEGNMIRSWDDAVPNALRRNPDVIVVGEVRTRTEMKNLVTASRTGHSVYSTLHADGAASTVNRLINTFPVDEQPNFVEGLLSSLKLIIHQRLVKSKLGGRVLIVEYLVFTKSIRQKLMGVAIKDIPTVLNDLVEEEGLSLVNDIRSKQTLIDDDEYEILINEEK
jgi:defect in organelle trafficking protein DotB